MRILLPLHLVYSLILVCFFILPAQGQIGNLKKKLDNKVKESTKSKTAPSSGTSNTGTSGTASTVSSLSDSAKWSLSDEEALALKLKYAPYYYSLRNLSIKELQAHFIVDQLKEYKKANWNYLSTELEKDKSKYPGLFAYYGMDEKDRYADLPYKGNQRAPWEGQSADAGTVNMYLRAIYEFKASTIGQERKLAEIVQLAINQAESAMAKDKVDKAVDAQTWLEIARWYAPENPILEDLEKEVNRTLNRAMEAIDHLITGDFHKRNLKRIVAFNTPTSPGKENPDNIITVFEAGTPVYLNGYFQTDMKSTGGIPTFKMIHYDDEYKERVAKGYAEKMEKNYFQPMYVSPDNKAEIEFQGYFTYALFPEISSLNYDSHLEYIPHLNFAKWVSTLLPGEYDFDFIFGIRHEMGRAPIKMIVTAESREKVRNYYQKLYDKKVEAVTFPMPSCQNKAAAISNLSDMAKYGTLLKLDYSQTGDIMFPWPRDHEVQFNTASGYGVFEKDGKVEVIHLEFRKEPTSSQFNFHSIGKIPSDLEMQCPNQIVIKPEILDYGYEMKKDNIHKCRSW